MPDIQPVSINRDALAKFIKDPRTIREFESLTGNQQVVNDAITSIQSAPLISTALSDVFSNDRVLAGSSDITLDDAGPKGNLTLELSSTGVTPDSYGDDSHLLQITVDAKGRIVSVSEQALDSDNVTEGVTNLFYTDDRARAALSEGTGIDYNPVTGSISTDPAYINSGTYTPTTGNLQSVDAVSVTGTAKWERIGNIVTVSVFVNVDPTTSGVLTAFNVSLPVASNFAAVSNCIGNANCGGIQQSGFVIADPVNDAARVVFLATSASANDMAASFRYEVLP